MLKVTGLVEKVRVELYNQWKCAADTQDNPLPEWTKITYQLGLLETVEKVLGRLGS